MFILQDFSLETHDLPFRSFIQKVLLRVQSGGSRCGRTQPAILRHLGSGLGENHSPGESFPPMREQLSVLEFKTPKYLTEG